MYRDDIPWLRQVRRVLNGAQWRIFRAAVAVAPIGSDMERARLRGQGQHQKRHRDDSAFHSPHQSLFRCFQQCLFYLPQGGEVTVNLRASSGQIATEWLYAAEGTPTHAEPVLGGGQRTWRAPSGGDAVPHLWSKCRAATAKELAFQSGGELCYFARK